MNEDRVTGTGKKTFGKGEQAVPRVVGSDRKEEQGVIDQVTGAIQHGCGELKDGAQALTYAGPGTFVID